MMTTRQIPANLAKNGMNPLSIAYKRLLDAAQKSVTVSIDPDSLHDLKKNEYKICFAKKVGDSDYNVVWQSYDSYLSTNTFSWEPRYQLFASNIFEDSVKVQVTSNLVEAGLGEQATLDCDGVLSEAVSGPDPTSMVLVNQYGKIHAGVNQICTGLDGKISCTPIYVSENSALVGNIVLQPKEKILIWFEQDIETETMFSTARSREIELDLTGRNTMEVAYNSAKGWTIVG